MADTVFVNAVTLSDAAWFNDINRLHYTILGNPANLAAVKTTLGTGGMTFTGPVLHADGTAAAPGISWANEQTSGVFRIGSGAFTSVVGTTTIWQWDSANVTFVKPTLFSTDVIISGSASPPGGRLTINGAFNGSLAALASSPLVISSIGAGTMPCVTLVYPSFVTWGMYLNEATGNLNFGTTAGTGPGAIGGTSMMIDRPGNVTARSFNQVTLFGADTDGAPITTPLASVLSLVGRASAEGTGVSLSSVQGAFPNLVSAVEAGYAINYNGLSAPMIEAIRELDSRLSAGGL